MGSALPAVTGVLMGGATGFEAWGQMQQAQAAKGAAYYNADVARQNANIALQNANIAGQAGYVQAANEGIRSRAVGGALRTNNAAGGLDVSSGSGTDVRGSARDLGMLSALTARSEAIKQGYGYEVQGKNMQAQSALDIYEGNAAYEAGEIGVGSTILGNAAQAGQQWMQWQRMGGMGG